MAKAWLKALGPIGLLILAIGLIVVAIVVLWKRSQTFRTIVLAVWNAIKVAAKASANAIKSAFTAAWSKISAAARAVGNVVRAVFNAVRSAIRAVIGVVSSLIGRIRGIKVPGTIKAAFAAIKSAVGAAITVVGNLIAKIKNLSVPGAVKTALNGIKEAAQSALNVIKNIVEWLGNIPTPHINWPSPPKWLDKVMPGMIAPPGVPVARASTAPGVATRGPGGTALAGGTGMGLTINVYGAIDPESTARAVRRVLDGHDRRMGRRVG
jgi:phage-related protein